jgi:hypothetical protein
VIVPTWNEARSIAATLEAARGDGVEIIVVDAGSTDGTARIAHPLATKVLTSRPGRARQQNLGARAARGDILLFCHADTILPPGYPRAVEKCLCASGTVAGAFRFRTSQPGIAMRCIEFLVQLRCRLFQTPYGDQAIFLRKDTFQRVGGFAQVALAEDLLLVRRLARLGRIALTPQHVVTSARRYRRLGVLRTTCINQAVLVGLALGVCPDRLASFYSRGQRR